MPATGNPENPVIPAKAGIQLFGFSRLPPTRERRIEGSSKRPTRITPPSPLAERGRHFGRAIAFLLLCILFAPLQAATLKVGPRHPLQLPSQAAQIARDGDIIEIEAGDYPRDVAVWRANRLTLRGVGGKARLLSQGQVAQGKAIWVIKGDDTTIEHIEFHGAWARDRNGAGIRQEGRNLTVRHSLFRDNQNGILTGANPDSEILVEYSEFDHNGHGDGRSHNLYIGAVGKFTLRFSYSHHARVGHQVKSRARENHILHNLLADGGSGRSSYLLDLPSGGLAHVVGNVMHQGPLAENSTLISYGAEKIRHQDNRLFLIHNTLANSRVAGCRVLRVREGLEPARMVNNALVGCTRMNGPVEAAGNVSLPWKALVDPDELDFRLKPGSLPDGAGIDLDQAGLEKPTHQYRHPAAGEPRPDAGKPVIGALANATAHPSPVIPAHAGIQPTIGIFNLA